MPVFEIRLLGDFEFFYNGKRVTALHQTRLQSLIAFLILHHDTPQARQKLAFLFWPDSPEAQALTNLRNLLHKLRQSLPEPERLLYIDMHSVQWRLDPACLIDVVTFEITLARSVTRADLEHAAQLYRGDLLPSCYEDWIVPARERLRQQGVNALTQLIDLLEEERAYRTALTYCQQLRALDPLDEVTYQRLMRLHAALGDRAGALRVYAACVRTLQEELNVTPSPSMRELNQRLLSTAVEPPSSARPGQEQLPLVGRRSEWKILLDAWYAAVSGIPAFVLLSGEAGIGKTRLAEELATWVDRQGFVTAVAHCYAAEGALNYAPVADWLHSPGLRKPLSGLDPVWRREVARLLPELRSEQEGLPEPAPITQGWQRQHLFEGLARAAFAVHGPLLLWIDDVQWADRDTLEWLHYLLRFEPADKQHRQPVQVLVVATLRSEEVTFDHPLVTLLTALRAAERLHEIPLGPLAPPETAALAMHLAGHALPAAQAEHLHRESEGNPLFLVEMMDAQLSGEERHDGSSPQSATLTILSPKLLAVIQSRLARLSPLARELVVVAATIGRAFTFGVLGRAWGQDEEILVGQLR